MAEQVAAVIENQVGIEAAGVTATKQFLKRYSEEPGKSVLRIASSAGVPSSGLSRFILQPRARLRLHAFLRIAAAERFALVDLLLGRASPGTLSSHSIEQKGRNWQRRADCPSLREQLVEGLAQQRRFADFAREAGVPQRTLRKNFPAECAAMTEQTRALVRERKAAALLHDIVRCEDMVDDVLSQGRGASAALWPTGTKLTASQKRVLKCFRGLLEGTPFERAWGSEPERLMLEAVQRLSAKYGLRWTIANWLTAEDGCRWLDTTA